MRTLGFEPSAARQIASGEQSLPHRHSRDESAAQRHRPTGGRPRRGEGQRPQSTYPLGLSRAQRDRSPQASNPSLTATSYKPLFLRGLYPLFLVDLKRFATVFTTAPPIPPTLFDHVEQLPLPPQDLVLHPAPHPKSPRLARFFRARRPASLPEFSSAGTSLLTAYFMPGGDSSRRISRGVTTPEPANSARFRIPCALPFAFSGKHPVNPHEYWVHGRLVRKVERASFTKC
jgi:hypothetical protein